MSKLQALLVSLTGAAVAIPGMAAIKDFEVPGGAEPLFAFALATASALVVLTVYTLRRSITPRSTKLTTLIAAVGSGVSLGLFLIYLWVSNLVLVTHEWREEPARQFVPLFLPDTIAAEIGTLGSRRAYIMKNGPDAFISVTTEWNTTVSLGALLVLYTALVAVVSGLFTVMGLRELDPAPPKDPGATSATPEGSEAA